jgi:hypothetical protein
MNGFHNIFKYLKPDSGIAFLAYFGCTLKGYTNFSSATPSAVTRRRLMREETRLKHPEGKGIP